MNSSIHKGSPKSISETATPGLLFLKQFLPALDSLDPSTASTSAPEGIDRFLAPTATFRVNSNPPSNVWDVIPLLRIRDKYLSTFRHEIETIWDIGVADGRQRTVMFEATSVTAFREDEDQFEVRLKEFNVLDLETEGKNHNTPEGLRIVGMRTYMDVRPLQDRAARMQPESVEVPE